MKTVSQDLLKKQVKRYWDNEPCGTGGIRSEEGSIGYFEEIENHRYAVEPFIHSFAQFTRWHRKKVLEVGCGCGTDLLQFARAGGKVYGVDLSPNSVNLVRRRFAVYRLRAEVMEADAENLPFPDEQFDLVYSWGVLHHTPEPLRAIKEIYRVLKPSGSIRIMVYNRISWIALKVYLQHGLLAGKPFTPLSQVIAEHQESLGTKAYSVREARTLFSLFTNLEVRPILTYYDSFKSKGIFPPTWLIRLLGDRLGWFMLISGRKGIS